MKQPGLDWERTGLSAIERKQRRQELAESYRACIDRHELFYPYVAYPYIEWYSEANGRVVLELEPNQVAILGDLGPWRRLTEEAVFEERMMQPIAAILASVGTEQLLESSCSDVTTPKAKQANQ